MKIKLVSILLAFSVVAGLSIGAQASIVDSITSAVTQAKTKGAPYLCRKGSFWDFQFSIRSAKGNLCKNKVIAALAVYMCLEKNLEQFTDSGCYTNAKSVLGEEVASSKAEAKKVALEEAKKLSGPLLNAVKGVLGM